MFPSIIVGNIAHHQDKSLTNVTNKKANNQPNWNNTNCDSLLIIISF